ncbi:YdcF family protein [Paraburkholderia dinghuensis]|uniref:YdcF family protein n=1 Tax=Paraburkholderia dinghuensis TaxID=2305225 RepID=A0A3N6Q579_9BURK|nr:YdcF family protein [Paraburkholderia dinghuensis]
MIRAPVRVASRSPHRQRGATIAAQKRKGATSRKPYVTLFKLILFVFFVAFIAVSLLWRSARTAIAVITGVLFWLLASGWLTGMLLDLAQPVIYRTPYDPAQELPAPFGLRTGIVVLGGGTRTGDDGVLVPKRDVYARLSAAASLYRQCKLAGGVCRVIVSGGNPQRHTATEADTYAPYLLRAGVASVDLVLENTSLTTWQNARNVMYLQRAQPDDILFLITSAYHMQRALLDFQRFGANPVPVVSGVRHAQTGWWPRLVNLCGAQIALHELFGMVQFHAYRMIGWF